MNTKSETTEGTKNFVFKTNINCGGCIAKVTPTLNSIDGIVNWEVNTADKNKLLTVQSSCNNEQEIINRVQNTGYKIEKATV